MRTVAQRPPRRARQATRRRRDGQDFDRGEADRVAVFDIPVLGDARLAIVGQRHVRAGAAHVETDGIGEAAEIADEAAGNRARRNAGTGETRREFLDARRRHHAAAAVEQQKVAGIAAFSQLVAEPRDVVDHDGRADRVGHGGGEALMLEDFRHDFGRDRDRNVGHDLLEGYRAFGARSRR